MADLSPAAQAVLDAASQYEINPECYSREIAAAALRAVADQVVPEDFCAEVLYWSSDDYEKGQEIHNSEIRSQLLTIAAELEGK
jgi:hypothetical protein